MSGAELQVFLRTKFVSAQDFFGFADRLIEVLGEAPPTVLIGPSKNTTSESFGHLVGLLADWTDEFSGSKHELLYRAVGLDRLSWIMQGKRTPNPMVPSWA